MHTSVRILLMEVEVVFMHQEVIYISNGVLCLTEIQHGMVVDCYWLMVLNCSSGQIPLFISKGTQYIKKEEQLKLQETILWVTVLKNLVNS